MSYRISNKAAEDLIHIYREGVVLFGESRAELYHYELERIFDFLSAIPQSARERGEITPPVRVHPFGSHMVIYMIDDEGVYILRVRHSREDWTKTPL